MALVKSTLVVGENGHGADGVVVSDEGNAAETASLADGFDAELFDFICIIFTNQNRLPRSNDVLGEMVSGVARAPRDAIAADDFQLKVKFVAHRIELGDVEVFDVEEAAQFFPDFFGEFFFLQRGAEDAADFVEHVQFFGAARSLLNQVAVLDGHTDLMAESQKKAQLRGRKAAIIRHDDKTTVQSLREHALNFSADKTRSGELEVGKGQHVARDAALFLLVKRHDHEHGDKGAGSGGDYTHRLALKFGSGFQKMQGEPENSPGSKRKAEEAVGKSLLAAAFLPEDDSDANVEK